MGCVTGDCRPPCEVNRRGRFFDRHFFDDGSPVEPQVVDNFSCLQLTGDFCIDPELVLTPFVQPLYIPPAVIPVDPSTLDPPPDPLFISVAMNFRQSTSTMSTLFSQPGNSTRIYHPRSPGGSTAHRRQRLRKQSADLDIGVERRGCVA